MSAPPGGPTLGVLYDIGSAGPGEVLGATRGLCDLVFLFDRASPHAAASAPMLRTFGRACDLTGLGLAERGHAAAAAGVTHLVTFSELQMRATAELAARTGISSYHSLQTVEAVTDKLCQRTVLAAAGVQSTASRLVEDLAALPGRLAEVGLPAVVKPRAGAGSVATFRVDTPADVPGVVAELERSGPGADGRARQFVVEALLAGDPSVAGPGWGDYISVESVVDGDDIVHVCVTGKFPLAEPFRETGMVVPATVPAAVARQAEALTAAALRALGVAHGVTHTELKLTRDGPRIIEVNGRLGGYVPEIVRRSSGHDLVRTAVRSALGLPCQAPRLAFDGVTFAYFLPAPVGASRVTGVRGADRVRSLRGVRRLDLGVRAGSAVDWRLGTQSHLGILYGASPTHEAALELLEAALARLEIAYEPGP